MAVGAENFSKTDRGLASGAYEIHQQDGTDDLVIAAGSPGMQASNRGNSINSRSTANMTEMMIKFEVNPGH